MSPKLRVIPLKQFIIPSKKPPKGGFYLGSTLLLRKRIAGTGV